jgi:hypothetical protein
MTRSFDIKRFISRGLLFFAAFYFLKLVKGIVRSAIGSGKGFPGCPVVFRDQIFGASFSSFPAGLNDYIKEKRLADFEKPAAFPAKPGFGRSVPEVPGLLLAGFFYEGRQLFKQKLLFKIC